MSIIDDTIFSRMTHIDCSIDCSDEEWHIFQNSLGNNKNPEHAIACLRENYPMVNEPESFYRPSEDQINSLTACPWFWDVYAPDIESNLTSVYLIRNSMGEFSGWGIAYEIKERPKQPGFYYGFEHAALFHVIFDQ